MFRSTFAVGIAALMGTCGCSQPAAINHRANNALCSTLAGPGDCGCTAGTGGASCSGPEFTCTSDTDCTQGINGRCIHRGAGAGCGCTYDQCSSDNDCPTTETCACHGSLYTYGSDNFCVAGNCRIDSDCGINGFCSASGEPSIVGYFCHTPQDTCINDNDCSAHDCRNTPSEPRCVYSRSVKRWQCACIPQCDATGAGEGQISAFRRLAPGSSASRASVQP